jgi:hypothetical protein
MQIFAGSPGGEALNGFNAGRLMAAAGLQPYATPAAAKADLITKSLLDVFIMLAVYDTMI